MNEKKDIQVLFSEEQIKTRIENLASAISLNGESGNTVMVCVLKGAFIFLADLCRGITIDVDIDFITASSYEGTESSGKVKISSGNPVDYKDKNVILVEDIVDTGTTMQALISLFNDKGAKSVKVAALLSKSERRKHHVEIDYLGFEVDNLFVVGYGLDHNQMYRNLPFIGVYK